MKNMNRLAVVDIRADHSSAYSQDLLLDTMKEFNITKPQMFACVIDNASNMILTVQLLNEEKENDDQTKSE